MKKHKKIWLFLLVLVLLTAAGGVGYQVYLQVQKTPDEIIEIEKQKTVAAYKENLEQALNSRRKYDFIVVLNPAHGGADEGYENAFGREKNITLAICNKVIALNTDPNVGIFVTRSKDVEMDQEMRLSMVEQMQPNLVVDVHVNKNANAGDYGISVSYDTAYYNRKLSNVEFADIMEKNVVSAIEGFAVGIVDVTDKEDGVILKGLTMPAVSVACGNMSNELEGELLTRDNYQANLAGGILDGIYEAREILE